VIGFINQQIKPIEPETRDKDRIKKEKLIICSRDTWKVESNKIKVASRVPRPKIDIGKRVIKVAIVTAVAK